jgi:catechol 2,3-dioxygenase
MATLPLDVDSLIAEGADPSKDWPGIHPLADMGHVHLQVSDLARAREFYHGLLGLDITQQDYPGALFLSAGGYHHHLGLNLWAGQGAPAPPPDSLGLESFALRLPRGKDLVTLVARIDEALLPLQDWHVYGLWEGPGVYDPDGNLVELIVRDAFLAATDKADLLARLR